MINRLIVTACATLLACLLGCTSDTDNTPCAPAIPSGKLCGTISTGQLPVAATVEITSEEDFRDSQYYTFSVDTDPSGYYSVDLAPGNYLVKIKIKKTDTSILDANFYYLPNGATPRRTHYVPVYINESSVCDVVLGSTEIDISFAEAPSASRAEITLTQLKDIYPINVSASTSYQGDSFRFNLEGVPPGSYLMELDLRAAEDAFYLPQTRNRELADTLFVTEQEIVRYSTIIQPPVLVQGEITGGWQKLGSPSPSIRLVSQDDSFADITNSISVTEDGQFDLPLYAPEPFICQVSANASVFWVGGGFSRAQATIYRPVLGEILPPINWVGSAISIVINNPVFPQYDRGYLRLYRNSTSEPPLLRWSLSSFHSATENISGLSPGTYYLLLQHSELNLGFTQNWVPHWYDGAQRRETATPIVIEEAGEAVTVNVQLSEGNSLPIEVVVNNPSDDRLKCAPVITYHDSNEQLADLYSNWRYNGDPGFCWFSFILKGLPTGEYKIGAKIKDEGYDYSGDYGETVWYPGTTDWNSAAIISIPLDEAIPAVSITIP